MNGGISNMRYKSIGTGYAHTISMSIEDGELFAISGVVLRVHNRWTKKKLGFITSSHFAANKEIRSTEDGTLIYRCTFLIDP